MHYLLESEQHLRQFSGIVSLNAKRKSHLRTLRNMYYGDMWDKGSGYIGPLPIEGDPNQSQIMHTLQRQFTSRNVIKEIVDRAVDALLGRSPDYKIYDRSKIVSKTIEEAEKRRELERRLAAANQSIESLLQDNPDPGEPDKETTEETGQEELQEADKKIAEAEIILTQLWTNADIAKVLREVMTEYLITGRSYCRLYFNKNFTRLDDVEEEEILIEATKYVKAENLSEGDVRLVEDEGEQLSIVKLEKRLGRKDDRRVEISFVAEDGSTYIAEFTEDLPPVNTTNPTAVNYSGATGDENQEVIPAELEKIAGKAAVSTPFKLDGNIVVGKVEGEPYVNDQMIQMNRAINLDLTLAISVLVESGFSEMTTTNVELETEEKTDTNTGKTIKVPKKLLRGPTTTNNLVGIQTVDAEGNVKIQNPGVIYKNPTPLTTFQEGLAIYYNSILQEAKQAFIVMNEESTVTGESRIQARQDFVKRIQRYKPDLDKFGSWFLTTLLHLTAAIADKQGYFEKFNVVFDSKLSAGELSTEEKQVVISQFERGLISKESAMVLLGVEDPILEQELVRVDQAEAMDLQVRRLVMASKYSQLLQPDQEGNSPNSPLGGSQKQKDDFTSNRDRNDTRQAKEPKTGGLQ